MRPTQSDHSDAKVYRWVIVSYSHDLAQATRVLAMCGLYSEINHLTPDRAPYARFRVNEAFKDLLNSADSMIFSLIQAQAEEWQRIFSAPVDSESWLSRSKTAEELLGSSNNFYIVDSPVLDIDDPDAWFEARWQELWPTKSPFKFARVKRYKTDVI